MAAVVHSLDEMPPDETIEFLRDTLVALVMRYPGEKCDISEGELMRAKKAMGDMSFVLRWSRNDKGEHGVDNVQIGRTGTLDNGEKRCHV